MEERKQKIIRNIIIGIILCATALMIWDVFVSLNMKTYKLGEHPAEVRFNEMQVLLGQGAYEEVYDDYYSRASKIAVARDEFLAEWHERTASDMEYGIVRNQEVRGVVEQDAKVYIDNISTAVQGSAQEDVGRSRSYSVFVKEHGEWFYEAQERPLYCLRKEMYEMPSELHEAFDLAISHFAGSNNAKMASFLHDIRNCVALEFAGPTEGIGGVSASFVYTQGQSLEKFIVKVDPAYEGGGSLATSLFLAHELIHVAQFVERGEIRDSQECFFREADALVQQSSIVREYRHLEESRALDVNGREFYDVLKVIAGYSKRDAQKKVFATVQEMRGYQEQCAQFIR